MVSRVCLSKDTQVLVFSYIMWLITDYNENILGYLSGLNVITKVLEKAEGRKGETRCHDTT